MGKGGLNVEDEEDSVSLGRNHFHGQPPFAYNGSVLLDAELGIRHLELSRSQLLTYGKGKLLCSSARSVWSISPC